MKSLRKVRPILALGTTALVAAAIACSSSSTPKPGELGGCTPVGDASTSCLGPNPGSGGGGNPGGGDGGGKDAWTAETGTGTGCGTAQQWVQTSNQQCAQCITGASPGGCCEADLACSSQPQCIPLLTCTMGCSGDATCISNCQASYPNGVSAYLGFAQCVDNACLPMCPNLPLAQAGDF